MKINCGPTFEEKQAARKEWHRWFAWRPVRVGSGDCRWLETIERRISWQPNRATGPFPVSGYWLVDYRAIGTGEGA